MVTNRLISLSPPQSLRDELEAALSEQGLRGVPYRPSQTVVAEGAAGQAVAEMFYIAGDMR